MKLDTPSKRPEQVSKTEPADSQVLNASAGSTSPQTPGRI